MIDTLKWVVLSLLLFASAGLGLAITLNAWAMVDAVNAAMPDAERFQPLGWWAGKTFRLHAQYRRLYPSGTLLRREGIYCAALVACLTLATTLLGSAFVFAPIIAIGGAAITWALYFKPGA